MNQILPRRPVYASIFYLLIYLSIYRSLCGSTILEDLGRFFSFLIYTKSAGLLWRWISPSQGRYLHIEQHKHRMNAHRHPCLKWHSKSKSQWSKGEDFSCLTPSDHRVRFMLHIIEGNFLLVCVFHDFSLLPWLEFLKEDKFSLKFCSEKNYRRLMGSPCCLCPHIILIKKLRRLPYSVCVCPSIFSFYMRSMSYERIVVSPRIYFYCLLPYTSYVWTLLWRWKYRSRDFL
jgi:hypothetical protein